MKKVSVREARASFSTIVSEAAFGKERYVLTRNGKDVAAIVPIDDLEAMERIEDQIDLQEVKRRLAKGEKPIPLAQVKKSLGL